MWSTSQSWTTLATPVPQKASLQRGFPKMTSGEPCDDLKRLGAMVEPRVPVSFSNIQIPIVFAAPTIFGCPTLDQHILQRLHDLATLMTRQKSGSSYPDFSGPGLTWCSQARTEHDGVTEVNLYSSSEFCLFFFDFLPIVGELFVLLLVLVFV